MFNHGTTYSQLCLGSFLHKQRLSHATKTAASCDSSNDSTATITAASNYSTATITAQDTAKSIPIDSVCEKPLTKESILETYSDLFTGIGTFPTAPYKFTLKPNAKPARHAPRKVPIHLKEAFREEIDNLVELGILEPVNQPTDWVNSYVIVEKETSIDSSNSHSPNHTIKKKLRICLDPRDLNEALEREPYYSRSVDEIIGKFHNAKVFTIVDMNKGYWMVVLHPDSRKLTTMALEHGRFQWTRLPMGTVVASDIFQRNLDAVYINLPGVTGIADDMIVYGSNEVEHDENLLRFLEVTRKNNLRLNPSKLQFRKKSVNFFGHQWTVAGMKPDPAKVKAITSMEFPEDKETMQSFLGMVNFLNRFSCRLADLSDPLRSLCKANADYKPSQVHLHAFQEIKREFSREIELPYFNPKVETTLQTDASKKGLGAVLIQNGSPVYFASRALSTTEQNYQNLERETLGTIWGMERFHYFLYGKSFKLETDQKPLASIYKKHLIDISPRIQRLVFRSLPYDFNVEWIPGKHIPMADALSRVSPLREENGIQLPIIRINYITGTIPMPSEQMERIKISSANDPTLKDLLKYIADGWPTEKKSLPKQLQLFWNYRDELSVENGLLLKSTRILIPESLRKETLEQIHEGHMGIEKCLLRARESVFWPGISKDIKEIVEKCGTCQANATAQKLPATPSDIPPHAWHTLGSDLFYWKHQDFLVVADYYSKFLLVRRLPGSSTAAIIKELSMIFTEFGRPFIFRSDNGPCYASKEFHDFLNFHGIEHVTSSPHHPQSNGFAEAMVKIAKKQMERSTQERKPWNTGLLEYRCTPLSGTLPSPLELLMNRKPRTSLPQAPGHFQSVPTDSTFIREELVKRQNAQFANQPTSMNQTPVHLDFEPGQPVWVMEPNGKQWKPATIDRPAKEPSSFFVKGQDNSIHRRTQAFIKPRAVTASEAPQETYGTLPDISQPTLSTPVETQPTVASPVKMPTTPAEPRRSSRSTKGVPPARFQPD